MVAYIGNRPNCHYLTGGERSPAAYTAHQAVTLGDLYEQRTCGLGYVGICGMTDDGRECAVYVEQHRAMTGIGAQRLECINERGSFRHDL